MRTALRLAFLAALASLLVSSTAAGQTVALKRYETKYYIIFSDLDADTVREATLRITQMAEEYHARTKGFAGEIEARLPFYMFDKASDYVAAGGMPGSAGVFMGDRLMAIAGKDAGGQTWHIVQHEGFHQFVKAVIKGEIPIWANEGLAEYFGESLWTGDDFVTGIIPPERLARLRKRMAEGALKPLESMMLLPHEVWNAQLSLENYDQAWSMIQFLAHGDNGKYQKPFNGFLRGVSNGERWTEAWKRNFGSDVKGFEQRWRDYWEKMDPQAAQDLYARATVSTLTGFLGRAQSQKQTISSWDDFVSTARANGFKSAKEDWLPRGLLEDAVKRSQRFGSWTIEKRGNLNGVVCELDDGTKYIGTFKLRGQRIGGVDVKEVAGKKPGGGKAKEDAKPKDEATPEKGKSGQKK